MTGPDRAPRDERVIGDDRPADGATRDRPTRHTTGVGLLTRRADVELRPWRIAGLLMIPAAIFLSVSPVDPVPPCPLRAITGVPCPLCGSTRGVIAAIHGHLERAITLNPASLLAIVLAVALLVGWKVERVRIPIWVGVVVFGLLWAYQLFKYATGRPL